MREITVIFIFLSLVVTDFTATYHLHHEHKKLKLHITQLAEMLTPFAHQTIKHSYDEWGSQHHILEEASESILEKKISFLYFIVPGVNIFRYSNLRWMSGEFHTDMEGALVLRFENELTNLRVTGNVQFLRNGNSSCKIPFKYTLNVDKEIHLYLTETPTYQVKRENIIFEPLKWDTKLCVDVNKEPQSTYEDIILEATNRRLNKIITPFIDSVFKSMHDKCKQIFNFSKYSAQNDYTYLKPHRNTAMFPWLSDHDELLTKNLNSVFTLYVSFKEEETFYVLMHRDYISFDLTTITSRHLEIATRSPFYNFPVVFTMDKLNNSELPIVLKAANFLKHDDVTPLKPQDYSISDLRLIALTSKGIEDAFQTVLYDGIVDFINVTTEMLQPLDKHLLENSIIETETKIQNISDKTPYYKIETEGFKFHLENITCHQFDNLKNATFTYKKIKAQVEQFPYVGYRNNFITVSVSAKVDIRNAVVNISLHRHVNHKQKVEVHIDDNFYDADTTITLEKITSIRYRLPRDDRIAIGKSIRKEFIELIRKKIRDTVELMFYPIFNVCSNLSSTAAKFQSNHLNNQKRHFAIIHDDWIDPTEPFSMRPVAITINGLWNIKSTTIQLANGNVIFHNLRIENVTGSITRDYDSNETVTSHYNASCISLRISLKERDIQIKFPSHSNSTTFSTTPDISSPFQNITDMTNQFTSIVASFIKHSIFIYDPNYSAKVRKLAEETMKEAILKDVSSKYNATLKIINYFAELLRLIEVINQQKVEEDDHGKYSTYVAYESNVTMHLTHSYSEEEICDRHKNCSLNAFNYLPQSIHHGNVQLKDLLNNCIIQVPYAVNIEYECTVVYPLPDGHGPTQWTIYKYQRDQKFKTIRAKLDWTKMKITPNVNENTLDLPSCRPDTVLKNFKARANSTLQNIFNIHDTRDHWFCRFKYGFPKSSEKHFYSITKSINYTSDHFLMYYIKLNGLQNLKSHRRTISDVGVEHEITATNITAHIIWTYYIGDPPPRTLKKTSFRFNISLVAKLKYPYVTFNPRSQIHFSDHEYPNTSEKLKGTLEPIILSTIQQSIKNKFEYRCEIQGCSNSDKEDFTLFFFNSQV